MIFVDQLLQDLDAPLLAWLPYPAVALLVLGAAFRLLRVPLVQSRFYREMRAVDPREHGLAPLHMALLLLIAWHVLGVAAPGLMAWVASGYAVLYSVEVVLLACGFLALAGTVRGVGRRLFCEKGRAVGCPFDAFVLLVLSFWVFSGVYAAALEGLGTAWMATSGAAYARSLAMFAPDTSMLATLPAMAKLHIVSAFVVMALLPFSRLIQAVRLPWWYLRGERAGVRA